MEQKIAVITGADGGMGREITAAVAEAGYQVVMVCYTKEKGEKVKNELIQRTGNQNIEVIQTDLSSLSSVATLANQLLERFEHISLLMNNAGTLQTGLHITEDGLEQTVAVNYVAPYLLTRKLLPIMKRGTRVVSMVSCTYAVGKLDFPYFFGKGRKGMFVRIPVYSNTKLALLLFTLKMAELTREQGISFNTADPVVVSTPIITMPAWFDPLTDIFFRPFIRTPIQGAATAIVLLLYVATAANTGTFSFSCYPTELSYKYTNHLPMAVSW